jgi:hypothetical protein
VSLDPVTHKYTWHSTAGGPPGWPGGDITATISHAAPPPPSVIQWGSAVGRNATTLVANFPSPTSPHSILVAFLTEYGNLVSGGNAIAPPAPAGWTRFNTYAGTRTAAYGSPVLPSQTSVTFHPDGAGDVQVLLIAEVGPCLTGQALAGGSGQQAGANVNYTLGSTAISPSTYNFLLDSFNQNYSPAGAASTPTLTSTFFNKRGQVNHETAAGQPHEYLNVLYGDAGGWSGITVAQGGHSTIAHQWSASMVWVKIP